MVQIVVLSLLVVKWLPVRHTKIWTRLKFKRINMDCIHCGGRGYTVYDSGPMSAAPNLNVECIKCHGDGQVFEVGYRFSWLEPKDPVDKQIELEAAEEVLKGG